MQDLPFVAANPRRAFLQLPGNVELELSDQADRATGPRVEVTQLVRIADGADGLDQSLGDVERDDQDEPPIVAEEHRPGLPVDSANRIPSAPRSSSHVPNRSISRAIRPRPYIGRRNVWVFPPPSA